MSLIRDAASGISGAGSAGSGTIASSDQSSVTIIIMDDDRK